MSTSGCEFDVALAFAGGQREFVGRMAAYLKGADLNIFCVGDGPVRSSGKESAGYFAGVFLR
jgi:hypothetical protein